MHSRFTRLAGTAVLTGFTLASFSAVAPNAASADEQDPGVARISLLSGGVDVKRADSGDTVSAVVNAPLGAGDYLTTQDDARAELQLDNLTELRVAPATQLRFTTMTSDSNALQLAQGTVELRLFRGNGANPEIDTPNATVRPTGSGAFRVSVDNDGNAIVTVRSGEATVSTQNDSQTIAAGTSVAVDGGSGDAQFQSIPQVATDDFDAFNHDRDRHEADVPSYAYVDDQIVGANDLDQYGTWQNVDGYGQVWHPHHAANWAPYQDGNWTWEPYYGWTWVSAEPWGWAPYHYGRWFYASNNGGWCWTPATQYIRPVYRPAQVAFFSFGFGNGGGISIGFGNVGWVPLGPTDTFRPWWGGNGYGGGGYGGRGYGGDTVVNNITNITNVTNIYNYHNINAPGGIVAVRNTNFRNGEFRQHLDVTPAQLRSAKIDTVRGVVPIVPTARNLAYNGAQPAAKRYPLSSTFTRFKPVSAPAVAGTFAEQRAAVSTVAQRVYPTEARTFQREAPGLSQNATREPLTRKAPSVNAEARTAPVIRGSEASADSHATVPVVRGTTATGDARSAVPVIRGVTASPDSRASTQQQPRETQPGSVWDRFARPGSKSEGAVPKITDVRARTGEAARGASNVQARPSYAQPDTSEHRATPPKTAAPAVETFSGGRTANSPWDRFGQTSRPSQSPASTRPASNHGDDALPATHGSSHPSSSVPQSAPANAVPKRSGENDDATQPVTHRYAAPSSSESAPRHVAPPSYSSGYSRPVDRTAPVERAPVQRAPVERAPVERAPVSHAAPATLAAPAEHGAPAPHAAPPEHRESADRADSHHGHN